MLKSLFLFRFTPGRDGQLHFGFCIFALFGRSCFHLFLFLVRVGLFPKFLFFFSSFSRHVHYSTSSFLFRLKLPHLEIGDWNLETDTIESAAGNYWFNAWAFSFFAFLFSFKVLFGFFLSWTFFLSLLLAM